MVFSNARIPVNIVDDASLCTFVMQCRQKNRERGRRRGPGDPGSACLSGSICHNGTCLYLS